MGPIRALQRDVKVALLTSPEFQQPRSAYAVA